MFLLVMGVTGCGKTTVGSRLASRIGLPFYDADDFHPAENKAKMARDEPLTDADRGPWLERLAREIAHWELSGGAVLACSALKARYRDVLLAPAQKSAVVHLKIAPEALVPRLEGRRGQHEYVRDYRRIVEGQFRDLEEPEGAVVVDARDSVTELVEHAYRLLARRHGVSSGRLYFAEGGHDRVVAGTETDTLIARFVRELGAPRRVLVIPPDLTRHQSGAGELSVRLFQSLTAAGAHVDVLPALGTHVAMSNNEVARMFPGIPFERVIAHDFRRDLATLGEVPASFVRSVSEGRVDYSIPCEINRRVVDGNYDRIVSVGQLVPHEVIGIANHVKNIFVGTGGKGVIDRTHFLGAVCGLESLMGEVHTPVRDVLNYMAAEFGKDLPISYLLTVRTEADLEQQARTGDSVVTRGLFAGEGDAAYLAGAPLSQQLNVTRAIAPLEHVLVYLDPEVYHSTWLGNKAIYRTRCALARGAELTILAPGVQRFGEDAQIDALIRRHGYRGTPHVMAAVESDPELKASLSAAAHLIHGSSEGRFRVRYATGGLSQKDVESVGFEYASPESIANDLPSPLRDGFVRLPSGKDVFVIRNPGLGLWSL